MPSRARLLLWTSCGMAETRLTVTKVVAAALLAMALPAAFGVDTGAAQNPGGALPDPGAPLESETPSSAQAVLPVSSPPYPTTPILDDFNRPDEDPLAQGNPPAWSPLDPRGPGNTDLLSVVSKRAANIRTGEGAGALSYRTQNFPLGLELYATIAVKPSNGHGLAIIFSLRQEGSRSWDGYYLNWRALAGTDEFRIHRCENNETCTIVGGPVPLEYSSGDKFMVRRVGTVIEGWVFQAGSWSNKIAIEDPGGWQGGKVGLTISGNSGGARLDTFGGGAFSPLAPPPLEQSNGTCGVGVHGYSRSACRGLGVNTLTGAFTTQVVDLELPGIGVPFRWTRTYTSTDPANRLAKGWTYNYATSLIDDSAPLAVRTAAAVLGEGDVTLYGDDGQQLHYLLQGTTFQGPVGAHAKVLGTASDLKVLTHDQVVYDYDAGGRLESIRDRNNQGLDFVYESPAGPLDQVIDSVGRVIDVTFTGSQLTRITLPDDRYVEYTYEDELLRFVRDVRGGTTEYRYDAAGRLTETLDQRLPPKLVVRNVYEPAGERVTDQYNADDDHTRFDWDAGTQTATTTDPLNHAWTDVYGGNVVVKRANPLGHTTSFDYDGDLNVDEVTDPRGNTTVMEYDDEGNLKKRTAPDPLNYVETWEYTGRNDVDTYTDGRVNLTDFEYDAAGNLIWIEGPDADGPGPLGKPKTLYEPSPVTGLLDSVTDPRGKKTQFFYTAGNLTEIRTQMGFRTTMGYDSGGRLRSLVEPRGYAVGNDPADYTWLFTPNNVNQLETVTAPDPDGAGVGDPPSVTTYSYDPAGNLETRTDANGNATPLVPDDGKTTYVYDDANRLATVTTPDPDGAGGDPAPVTTYAYDDASRLESVTESDPDGSGGNPAPVTTYGYDEANRLRTLTRVTPPQNRVWTYEYDASGNLSQVIDANGNATPQADDGKATYGYDALNRLSGLTYWDTNPATPDVTFGYDANSNRTQVTDDLYGAVTYAFDPLNRLTSATRGADVFAYEYDLVNLTKATYPTGTPAQAVSYTYDDDERLLTAGPSGLLTTYGYDEAGHLKTTTLPSGNGYVETRSYDRAGRLTQVENKKGATTLSKFVVDPDPVGNPRSVVRTGSLPQTQTYTYDNLDRLTGVCFQAGICPNPSDPFIRWTYDLLGNRKSEQRGNPASTTNYTYNAAQELTQMGSTAFSYDLNGNQTQKGAATFAYDLANRLRTHVLGNTTTTYQYDGEGKRLQASTGSQASKKTNFLWDVNQALPQLALERDGNNALIRRYSYGARRISQTAGSNTSYYLYDGIGSVVNLTSATGATQWTWSWEPFGQKRTETKASGQQPDNFMRFTGEYADLTGLYHLRARQYDAQTGRFLTRDQVGGAYAYVGNQPTVYTDPLGLFSLRDVGHGLLDVVGLVPFFGEPADAVNCLWYGSEGDHTNAGFSCGAVLPFVGNAATAAKWGRRGANVADAAKAGDELAGSIRNVNPLGGTYNCVNCVMAGDATLAGRPAAALLSGPQPISALERSFGGRFLDVAGRGEIAEMLEAAGPGARGIVFGGRAGGVGHVFNAVNQGGTIRFLDPQVGRSASFAGYDSFKFLWTAQP